MRHKLTEKQNLIFRLIKKSIEHVGYPPTIDELVRRVEMATSSTITKKAIADHLEAIEKKGYVVRDGRGARAIRLIGYSVNLIKDEPEEGIFDGYSSLVSPIKIIIKDYIPERKSKIYPYPADPAEIEYEVYFVITDSEDNEKLIQVPDNLLDVSDLTIEDALDIAREAAENMEQDRQDEEYGSRSGDYDR